MTDLEIVQRCAEAMGIKLFEGNTLIPLSRVADPYLIAKSAYDPLHDDAQAMALVKRFDPILEPDGYIPEGETLWAVTIPSSRNEKGKKTKTTVVRQTYDLNRAICECVAKMQAAK